MDTQSMSTDGEVVHHNFCILKQKTNVFPSLYAFKTTHFLPFRFTARDVRSQISAFTILHYNVQRGAGAVNDSVVIAHYVLMFKLP